MFALEFDDGAVSFFLWMIENDDQKERERKKKSKKLTLVAFGSGPAVLAFADGIVLGIHGAFAVLARILGALVGRLALLADKAGRAFACVVLLVLGVENDAHALVFAWLA